MKIQILNKIPKVIGSDSIIKDNNDYAVTIYPDDEWKNKTITAVIVADTTAQYPSVILSNNTFTLPTVTGSISKLYVGFIAGELKTTAPVVIEVSESIRDYFIAAQK